MSDSKAERIIDPNTVVTTPFPAKTKQAASVINGIRTEVHVPLESAYSTFASQALPSDDSLLPMTHLTATTVLGGTGSSEREILGQLYATQIASAIALRNPEETRMLVLGLGLQKVDIERETFFDMMDLVGKCL
ncbi:hypothetical protein FGG08_002330 [Glutinoglossum americanum]|uniref:Proteasome assembly chaperone 3 n=1 Tax=Glutinoglossum americanum TaxID=1670608 RepID=A0A9P8I9K4_9PEZI|nr:hypothetical protein FGG08_002330 [Glutinoglossum americanum]